MKFADSFLTFIYIEWQKVKYTSKSHHVHDLMSDGRTQFRKMSNGDNISK